MSALTRYNKFIEEILPSCCSDPAEKDKRAMEHIRYMLARSHTMFKWENLPDTIPARFPELYLQINGNFCATEVKGDLYIFTGGMGGEPDAYYMPTIYTVANPALKFSRSLKINEECAVVPNDSMYEGLMPLYSRYASALAETELSQQIATINSRITEIISAADDATKESAEIYLDNIRAGKLGIIGETAFLDGIKVHGTGAGGTHTIIEDLIELEQYQKASWYNDIGLNANYNMKRESINASESQLNQDALLPLIDDMKECREKGIEKINEMYGTNISVNYNSSWQDNQEETELIHEELEGSANGKTESTDDI